MHRLPEFLLLPLKWHLMAGLMIRLLLIVYGNYHDKYYVLSYTDIDYKVFTDAARHVINGESPYKRHTFRYSPFMAYLMIPNIMVSKHFGKILFSFYDLLVTIGLKSLVQEHLGTTPSASKVATFCSLFWLYNPLSIVISTRGNSDSVACVFIITSLVFLQTGAVKGLSKYIVSGFLLGVSVHLRLYPLVFSFPMYLSLGDYRFRRNTGIISFVSSLLPNKKQILLTLSCVVTLYVLTRVMYALYGYEFLFETYIYHLFRKDTRHNFSLLFYYSYLTMDQLTFDVVKFVLRVFECIILFVLSLTYGCDPKTLHFALFSQAVVLVTFNSVITAQYFIWFLSLLPLVVHNFKISTNKAIVLTLIWAGAQLAWLFYAYFLEFKSRQVFILVWLKSVVFFCSNIYILSQLIKKYTPGYGFGQKEFSRTLKTT